MNTNTKNAEKNLYETWVDSQKTLIDNMTEATHKFTNDQFVNETIEKGSSFYKNWLDTQLVSMNEATEKVKTNPLNVEQLNQTSKHWMENQMNLTKDFMNFSMTTMKTYMESLNKSMPAMNGTGKELQNMFDKNMNLFNEWSQNLQKQYDQMMTQFNNADLKNVMSGMFKNTDMFNKFNEMWTPVIKAMQSGNFKMDDFGKMFDMNTYTDFVNKNFGFGNNNMDAMNSWMNNFTGMFNTNNPKDMFSNMTKMFNPAQNPFNPTMQNWMNNFQNNPANDMMKNWMNMNNSNPMMSQFTNMFQNPMMSNMFQNPMMTNMFQNPMMGNMMNIPQGQEFFTYMMNSYNTINGNLQNAFAPFAKLMTPNSDKTNMDAMSDMMTKFNQFMIKQSEMQYMTYTTGMKAMQKVAEAMQEKMKAGKEFKGMTALYQEYLNISDKVFVELFESDEYSKLQAEYASLSHSLKKDSELMMEKMLNKFPIITRTEMDDTYKTIYQLKKRVTELEKQIDMANATSKTTTVRTAPVAAAKPVVKAAPVAKKVIKKK